MIYVCEHHDQVLEHWRRRELREIRLVNVDFHDDLRGLLVDRRRRVAYPVGKAARAWPVMDPGNFLAHAVVEGRLCELVWVHGSIGGRAWDAGIVRYESDLFAAHHRLRRRLGGGVEYPLEFEETKLDRWSGPRPGQLLSVDWDCFASILMPAETIGGRVEAFVKRLSRVAPADSWIAYSPEYSHPTLGAFRSFVDRLSDRFAQPVEWLSPGLREGRLHPRQVRATLPRDPLMRLTLFLRRRGVF